MRKVFLLAVFILLTPAVLTVSFSLLFLLASGNQAPKPLKPIVAYAALPVSSGTLKTEITSVDGRKVAVKNFFKKYKSDLLPFADVVVEAADEYGLDYRLIPAIAMQESNLCKKLPGKLKGSNNCWGFGVYGSKVIRFDSYSEAIHTVTKALATKYKAKGLVTPEEIMKMYTPNSNGSWAFSVNHFMNAISANL